MSAAPNIKDVAPRTEQPGGGAALSLTPKRLRVYCAIREGIVRHGRSPSFKAIGDALGISKVTVFEHVETLIKVGALTRTSYYRPGSLALVPGFVVPGETNTRIAYLGEIR